VSSECCELRVGADKENSQTDRLDHRHSSSTFPHPVIHTCITTNASNPHVITMSLYDRLAFPLQPPNPSLHRPGQSSSSSFATEDKIRTLVDEFQQGVDLDEDEKMWLSRECIAR
jgi:hypothetical protein